MLQDNCINTIGEHPQSLTLSGTGDRLSWPAWLAQGRSLLVADLARAWAVLKVWQRRSRDRAHLAQLDDRMLDDIGLTQDQAHRIARKPFWKA